ncbi:annexin A1-like isoform X2 [Etheostoma cragini]|uniref:annexin A1-like isoform X2 n=1 Tax=Etheostoma cragini TaxID=417921 RepID=UPI00155DEA1A|nr:annexin A1-like isoform X2 [Etheostoma cragini]XP_034752786.1 annexin A1-like isoform X2 [Etheostoma cragini]
MAFFKKFFNNVIPQKDPDNSYVTVKDKPKPPYYGTVTPYPNFNATSDASTLQSAIKKVDKDVIFAILVKRSNEQRQKIKAVYEASAGQSLDKALQSVLSSHLEDLALALISTPAHFDAYLFRKATKGLGTHEHILVEILASRTNQEIREIKRVYKEVYKTELEDVIKAETRGDFTTALLAMLKANKDESTEINNDLVKRDSEVLFEAGEKIKGTNVSAFIDILTTRSAPQLCKTFQQYATISDLTLPKALQLELKGDIEDCLIDIVKCSWNTSAFFAEKLHHAMKNAGTNEDTLIRVLVSRSEVDLKKIVQEYKAMYGVSLQEAIRRETKEHFESGLLALCGPE